MSDTGYPSDRQDRFIMRLPNGMRDQIKERARTAGRSMNAEIVQILSAALNSQSTDEADMGEAKRTLNEQFMLRLPDGMRDEIAAKADENARSMTQEIVLALRAHLDGASRNVNDTRMMLAGQALNGILSGPHGVDARPNELTDAAARNIAHTALFLADNVMEAAQDVSVGNAHALLHDGRRL